MEPTAKDVYDIWHTNIASKESDSSNEPWHLLAKPHLGDMNNVRTLEIGCGRGGFSKYLCEHGANLVAADFSDSAVRIASQLLASFSNCETRVADIQNIPYPDNEFDLVLSFETLEHVPDPTRGMRELVRVTKPKGKIIITTPNYFSAMGLHRVYREATGRPWSEGGQPICHPLTLIGRITKLRKMGCQIDYIASSGYNFGLPGGKAISLSWLARPRIISRYVGAHGLTVVTKQ